MSYFYKYVDPAKLLVSQAVGADKDKPGQERDQRENTSLMSQEKYHLRTSPANSLEKSSPSPPDSPSKELDYESAF